MTKNTAFIGTKGENAACDYLKALGYSISERNYRVKGGEIDIVAKDGAYTVFVEVKSRSGQPSAHFGRASAAVDKRKRLCFVHAAKEYLKAHPEACKCRIDVVEVYFPLGLDRAEVRHVKSAFGANG